MLPKIGIVGIGFVGRAVKASLEMIADIAIVDSNPALNEHTYDDLMECEVIFVCVPSPQGEDGVCDASILQDVLAKLKGYTGTIISKTTAPPGVYKELGYMDAVIQYCGEVDIDVESISKLYLRISTITKKNDI